MNVRLAHSFIKILVSVTFLSEVFRLLIAPSGQVDLEARGLKEYISNIFIKESMIENHRNTSCQEEVTLEEVEAVVEEVEDAEDNDQQDRKSQRRRPH